MIVAKGLLRERGINYDFHHNVSTNRLVGLDLNQYRFSMPIGPVSLL